MNVFTIFTGDNKTMFLKAESDSCAGSDPLDLSSCTEIVVYLPKSDGSFATRKLSLGQVTILSPSLWGKYSVPISALVSASLNVGELQDFDVSFMIGSSTFTVRYYQALSVFELD